MRKLFTKKAVLVNVVLILMFFFLGYFLSRKTLDAYIEVKTIQRKMLAWIDDENFLKTGQNSYMLDFYGPPMMDEVPWSTNAFIDKFEKKFDNEFRSHIEIVDPGTNRDGKSLGNPANHLGMTWTKISLVTDCKGSWTLVAVSPFGAKIVESTRTKSDGPTRGSLMIIFRTSIF